MPRGKFKCPTCQKPCINEDGCSIHSERGKENKRKAIQKYWNKKQALQYTMGGESEQTPQTSRKIYTNNVESDTTSSESEESSSDEDSKVISKQVRDVPVPVPKVSTYKMSKKEIIINDLIERSLREQLKNLKLRKIYSYSSDSDDNSSDSD